MFCNLIMVWANVGQDMDATLWWSDFIFSCLYIVWLLLHGCVRILLTSLRLRIFKRWIIVLLLCIPLVHLFVLAYLCHIASIEAIYEAERTLRQEAREDSKICETTYPLLLLHGVGFRDLRAFNYWGRIPKELKRNGARIYYGNQEAWGTIQANGEDIKKRIFEILEETGCEKVNILAHSKGGLDARYAISTLQMAPYVASLTTISTPHRGCKAIDLALHIPDGIYQMIARQMNRYFSLLGDQHPDFYTASRQFSTAYAKRFNEENPDCEGVYYQSVMSVMSGFRSHYLLCLPYLLIQRLEGENDGLVSVSSSQWGKFLGVWRNDRKRGISHGDIIDLTREDYAHFDVREHYVELVMQLKEFGF